MNDFDQFVESFINAHREYFHQQPTEWLFKKHGDRLNLDISISTLEYRINGSTTGKTAEKRSFIAKHKVKNITNEMRSLDRLQKIKQIWLQKTK